MAPGFQSMDGKLYANGQPFHVKGINWYGSEHRTGAPAGLHKHSIDYYMDWLASKGFNAIRLLFNHESVVTNPPIESVDA